MDSTNTNGTNGSGTLVNSANWIRWMQQEKRRDESGLVPVSSLAFTREEILAKGVLTDADLGEGLAIGGAEYFDAWGIVKLEIALISKLPGDSPLPVVTSRRVKDIHRLMIMKGRFNLPQLKVAFRETPEAKISFRRHVRDWDEASRKKVHHLLLDGPTGQQRVRLPLLPEVALPALQRRSVLWVFGNEAPRSLLKKFASVVHIMHPELGLNRPEVWRRQFKTPIITERELDACLQGELREHLSSVDGHRPDPVSTGRMGLIFPA